jgi:2-polyprenyl-6-methoxyphenol hydroxylase-like FAD-dependent oxidoreductase
MGEPKPAAVVVGGGIGGVAAALALIRTGWSVVVLEKSEQPVDQGSGITLFANAMAALDAIGAGEAVRAAGAPPPAGSSGLRLPSGTVVVDASAVPAVHDLYAFHRAHLHRALRSQLPKHVLRTGSEVIAVRIASDRATVELADGRRLEADLVVAADGLRSRIRAALQPRYPGPRYAGYTSWRGVTAAAVDVAGIAGETWGAGERFGILPLRDGRVYWFAVANLPAGAAESAHEEVLHRFGGWHTPIPAVISATPAETILALDIHDLPLPLPAFAVGPVALLGDAAHAMTPDVGQGAGQAIEDAVVLAAALDREPTVIGALAAYDRVRRRRTAQIVRAARRTGRLAQAQHPLAVRLRTLLMRLTPPALSLKMIQRITSWTPPMVPESAQGRRG